MRPVEVWEQDYKSPSFLLPVHVAHVLYECLGDFEVVVESRQVQCREPVVFCLVDATSREQAGQEQTHGSGVPPQGSMMEGIEPIVVGDGYFSVSLQQQGDHIIYLL